MESESVKERLIKFLDWADVSQSKFEKKCGMSNGYVNNIRSSIQPDKLLRIAECYPELNIAWLMIGDTTGEEMIRGKVVYDDYSQPFYNPDYGLPLVPVEAIAGPGSPVFDDTTTEIYYNVKEFKNSDFLIRVSGDSMSPKFTGGDVVACKLITDRLFFQWGRAYVLYTKSQGVMIKRLQPSEKEDCVKCVSENANYAPFDVPMSDIVSLALVNGSISLE